MTQSFTLMLRQRPDDVRLSQAYFGGEARCDAEAGQGDDYDPRELICGACSDVSRAQVGTLQKRLHEPKIPSLDYFHYLLSDPTENVIL